MFTITDSAIERILAPFGVSPPPFLAGQIRSYSDLLLRWNQRISLTTVVDPAEIVRFHFGESFFAISLLKPMNGSIVDIGSGAGFPGLAIKLAVPELSVTLIESNVKKTTFLSEVTRGLNLSGVHVFRGRMEDFPSPKHPFDYLTVRALGSHEQILLRASKLLAPAGHVALWVSGEDASTISLLDGWYWRQPVLIPQTRNRFILIGAPRN